MTRYLMEDPREAQRLADKVDASTWVEGHLADHLPGVSDVLDVGCGPGVLAREVALRCRFARVIGLDGSEERVRDAVVRNCDVANLAFRHGDAAAMPFDDESFDLVYCRFLLEYLPDKARAVSEMRRVCRPGGRIILQDLDGQLVWHYPLSPKLQRGIGRAMKALAATGFDPHVGRKLYHLARGAGIAVTRVRVEPYHLYAGRIGSEDLRLWDLKLDIALPAIAQAVGGRDAAVKLKHQFLDHLADPATLTYSVSFTVEGNAPLRSI